MFSSNAQAMLILRETPLFAIQQERENAGIYWLTNQANHSFQSWLESKERGRHK